MKITATQAKEMMDSMDNIQIIDVRSKAEYDVEHIKNAICIPVNSINDLAPSMLLDKSQPLLVYCRTGARSERACTFLEALGYMNIYNFGGLNTWTYELVK